MPFVTGPISSGPVSVLSTSTNWIRNYSNVRASSGRIGLLLGRREAHGHDGASVFERNSLSGCANGPAQERVQIFSPHSRKTLVGKYLLNPFRDS